MTKKLSVWLWISVVLVILGAFLLYPIGTMAMNVWFFIWKAGMLVGLIVLLKNGRHWGYWTWVACTVGAIVMTCLKMSSAGVSFLAVLSIVVDVLMPSVAAKGCVCTPTKKKGGSKDSGSPKSDAAAPKNDVTDSGANHS